MSTIYDATKIACIINPCALALRVDFHEMAYLHPILNPNFVAAHITRRFTHAAVTIDTDGEWPRVILGATTLEIRSQVTDLGGGNYRAWETPRDAAERLLIAHGWDQSLTVKERIAALVRPNIRMEDRRNGCVVPIKHGEKIEVTAANDECTITIGDDCRHLDECKGIWEAAHLIDTLTAYM